GIGDSRRTLVRWKNLHPPRRPSPGAGAGTGLDRRARSSPTAVVARWRTSGGDSLAAPPAQSLAAGDRLTRSRVAHQAVWIQGLSRGGRAAIDFYPDRERRSHRERPAHPVPDAAAMGHRRYRDAAV